MKPLPNPKPSLQTNYELTIAANKPSPQLRIAEFKAPTMPT